MKTKHIQKEEAWKGNEIREIKVINYWPVCGEAVLSAIASK